VARTFGWSRSTGPTAGNAAPKANLTPWTPTPRPRRCWPGGPPRCPSVACSDSCHQRAVVSCNYRHRCQR
jgi:hypothetical protein